VSDLIVDFHTIEKYMLCWSCLVGKNRFLSEEESIKLEDASIEIESMLNELYDTL
jgi:hypothetical protein